MPNLEFEQSPHVLVNFCSVWASFILVHLVQPPLVRGYDKLRITGELLQRSPQRSQRVVSPINLPFGRVGPEHVQPPEVLRLARRGSFLHLGVLFDSSSDEV